MSDWTTAQIWAIITTLITSNERSSSQMANAHLVEYLHHRLVWGPTEIPLCVL